MWPVDVAHGDAAEREEPALLDPAALVEEEQLHEKTIRRSLLKKRSSRADLVTVAYNTAKPPGEWVAAQARFQARVVRLLMGAALILIADVLWFAIGLRNAGLTVLALLLLLAVQRLGARQIKVAANWLRGARSEQAVGETLAALTGEGYAVLHDIPQEFAGNIDHLVSGPSGVYMIETKHRRYQRVDLRKAKRQAAMLRDELGVWVTPVICLDQRRDRAPYRSEGVWIVCRTRLLVWIQVQRNRALEPDRLVAFAERL
jgi:hypothetical protein